ncbi:unnamed protein product, partial [marine sediment metagenome]
GDSMYAITAKVNNIETIEGNYKNIKIAERHLRRLEKKYTGTTFKIDRVNKKEKKTVKKRG